MYTDASSLAFSPTVSQVALADITRRGQRHKMALRSRTRAWTAAACLRKESSGDSDLDLGT